MKPDAWDLDALTFLQLATQNEHGELEGRLARSWEHSADFKEWTYHLRTDVRWDDGKPVTARDVAFTLDLLAHPAIAEVTGINATIVDDSTVRIRAAKPYYIDEIVYYPEHVLASLDPRKFCVGARIEIHRMDLNLVRRRIRAGEFDATIRTFDNELGGNFGQLKMFGPGSPIGYRNPRAWALLEAARLTVHPDSLDAIYSTLMPIFQADVPMTFLYPGVIHVAARRHVTGLSSPYRAEPTVWMAELALDNKR